MKIMRVYFGVCAILFIFCTSAFSQQEKLSYYKINGVINVDSGKIDLLPVTDTILYPRTLRKKVVKIESGKFSFEGMIPYPQGVILLYHGKRYSTDVFVIDSGIQTVTCNIDSNNETPKVNNRSMKDYPGFVNTFKKVFKKRTLFYKKWDDLDKAYQNKIPDSIKLQLEIERKKLYNESDSTLLTYINQYPASYFGFWKFIDLTNFGYEPIFDSIFSRFSNTLKNTYTGKVLTGRLRAASILAVGKKFPGIASVNENGIQLTSDFYLKNKYTLVDFWYSHCSPCIAQFHDLKNIYGEYKSKGFQIIGISTDAMEYKINWQMIIKDYGLQWLQYWDINGKESKNLSIDAYPSNFLLDENGKILKHDISPNELSIFLKTNLL